MTSEILLTVTDHKEYINKYIDWVFKTKKPFVILRSFVDGANNTTKMFIILPVRQRVFESDTIELFNPTDINISTFNFTDKDIKSVKTLYSGDIWDYNKFPNILSKFKHISRLPNFYGTNKGINQTVTLFKDYTTTRQKQEENYSLVKTFTKPEDSINSIYRLLQTKYITIIDITFNNKSK